MNRTSNVNRTRAGTVALLLFFGAVASSARAQTQNQPPPEETQGPEEATATIGGVVYLDADGDGQQAQGEPGLAGVTVELRDASSTLVATATTDASGMYSFWNVASGTWTVEIPLTTQAVDLNESLANWFSTSQSSQAVQLDGNDSLSNNFGFTPQVNELINDLNPLDPDGDGFTYTGDGRTIGFWKHQLDVAIAGKGKSQVSAATLAGYLAAIEAMYLPEPFTFPDGFKSAVAILDNTSSNPIDLLKKQLLGTEFNMAAGYGLDDPWMDLQGALIAWGEYIVANPSLFTSEEIIAAKDIFDLINNTGNN